MRCGAVGRAYMRSRYAASSGAPSSKRTSLAQSSVYDLTEMQMVRLLRITLARDPEARARFEREARAAAKLRSQHVVHVHDHGIDGENPFIVMELLEGQDLQARLLGLRRERRERVPLRRARRVGVVPGRLPERQDVAVVRRKIMELAPERALPPCRSGCTRRPGACSGRRTFRGLGLWIRADPT